ncbi:hypothetical protein GCM10011579_023200 [Streptomyces albiflavescens]|uniref:Uncharacterized protein n=1 Tax=Streptomyces albiflavescens TaxID=1623582 RepID=A0A917XY56_9ACTN|nr:hypothetical protein GCM10011579_023200 [Streptomyces albiflavescens]
MFGRPTLAMLMLREGSSMVSDSAPSAQANDGRRTGDVPSASVYEGVTGLTTLASFRSRRDRNERRPRSDLTEDAKMESHLCTQRHVPIDP